MSALSAPSARDSNVVTGERTLGHVAEQRAGWKRAAGTRGDGGSSLIFAMAFLLLGSLIVTTLAGWASSDLGSSAHFQMGRSLTYSADGAVSVAISETRYWYPPSAGTNGSWSGSCPNASAVDFGQTTTPAGVASFEPSISIDTWCTLQVGGVFSRLVTVQAYDVSSGGSIPASGPPSSWVPLASATVGYIDSQSNPPGSCSTSTCDFSMTILTWSVK